MTLEQALFHVLLRLAAVVFMTGVVGIPVLLIVGGMNMLPKTRGIVCILLGPVILITGLTLMTYWRLFF